MALLRSAATVGGYTFASRILGFVRDILIAAVLGAGPLADAFFVAFRFPNLFRRLVAEGAFAAAFVPLFSRHLERDGSDAAQCFAEATLAVMLAALLLFTLAVEIAMPWLIYLIAPGFADDAGQLALAVRLTRIAFPYLLFMALAALLGAVLNALYRFAAAAAAPLLLNLVLITVLLGFAEAAKTPADALAWGVAVAGVLQFLWLAVACARAGMALHLPRPRLGPEVRRLLRLMWPAGLAAGVMQINLLIGTVIATLEPGAVSWLYYADRVYQLPLGVVGIAIGTALLPTLSRRLGAGEDAGALQAQARAVEVGLLLTLPAAAALMTIPGPIVSVLFARGAFAASDAQATAAALAAFAAGLPAFVLVKVLAPGFFARADTVAPLKVSVVAVIANIGLSLALFVFLGHVGIALATTLASWLQAGLLGGLLYRRGFLVVDGRLKARLPRAVAASAAMATALWALRLALAGPLAGGAVARAGGLALLVATGLAVFFVCAHVFGAARLGELRLALHRRP